MVRNQRVTLTIGQDIPIGHYYILAEADSQNNVLEQNEANNLTFQPLKNTDESSSPDLFLTDLVTPSQVELGKTFNLNYTLINQGKGSIQKTFFTHIFLSQDTHLDEDDRMLSFKDEAGLAANSSRSGTQTITLEDDLIPGNYYLIGRTDSFNQIEESNENNNTLVRPITITKAVPTNPAVHSSISGYGTVNASAAIAQVIGRTIRANADPSDGNTWGANLIKAPEVWAQGYTGQGIIVAVLDSGVDRTHSELRDNIWRNRGEIADNGIDDDRNGFVDDVYGWNFINNNNNTHDSNNHGTHVAGIIAAANNNTGVTGIAYDAQIMPIKVLSDKGSGNVDALAQGIYYAVEQGADVINLSLASPSTQKTLQDAIAYASSKGAIVVSAAGNASAATPSYPAAYAVSHGLAVGAVDRSNRRAEFSNKAGNNPNLVYVNAPGTSIHSTLPGDRYGFLSGTSMATPHVAGVIALMLSADDDLTETQIRQILINTATPLA
jgi:subtilisin family serine protease